MADLLQRLLEAQRKGRSALNDALLPERSNLSAQLAEQARTLAQNALQTGDADQGFAGYAVATEVFEAIGHHDQARENHLNMLQILFMLAQSEDEYNRLYEAIHVVLARKELTSPGLRFRAIAFAADCAYWAADSSLSTSNKKEWLTRTFDDLEKGATLVDVSGEEGSRLRYASCLVVALQTLIEIAPDPQTVIVEAKRFASLATVLLRSGLSFPEEGKTVHIASALQAIATGKFVSLPSPLYGRKGD